MSRSHEVIVDKPPEKRHPAYESGSSLPPTPPTPKPPKPSTVPRSGHADLLEAMSMMLDDKLDTRFRPFDERLRKLETGSHKRHVDTEANIARTRSEADLTRSNDLSAITTAFEAMQTEVKETKQIATETNTAVKTALVPATKDAQRAANQASAKADATNVSLDNIENKTDKMAKWYNHPALKTIIQSIVSAIGAYLAAGGKLPGCEH